MHNTLEEKKCSPQKAVSIKAHTSKVQGQHMNREE